MTTKTILSIQSHVVYGHVGNSAAVFPLQRLGHEVLALNTVQFSNHPGHGAFAGEVFAPSHIATLLDGLAALGVFPTLDAVLTGYLGSPALGNSLASALDAARGANPALLYCCDPVLGDVGKGLYVPESLIDVFRTVLLPRSAIATPNLFELEILTGVRIAAGDDVRRALDAMHALGPRRVLVTSLPAPLVDTDWHARDDLFMVVSNKDDAAGMVRRWCVSTPRFDRHFYGAGDLTAALFLAHILSGLADDVALARTAGGVYGVLLETHNKGGGELALIAAQKEYVAPKHGFVPQNW